MMFSASFRNVCVVLTLGALPAKARRLHPGFPVRHVGLLVIVCCLNAAEAQAQSGVWPSHGKKVKLDSYNYLLRDVHPASQAQANYLQNRLILTGTKKAERLERQERLDVYRERQFIKTLEKYDSDVRRLSAGRPVKARSLVTFWVLVSVFGDRTEVYESLSSEVPPILHREFVSADMFIRIIEPNGELQQPPLLLENAKSIDASKFQSAWHAISREFHATGRLSAREVADFHDSVAVFCKEGAVATNNNAPTIARVQADHYLMSLRSLADAIYRPKQCAQIQHYMHQTGYAYSGGSMLGLIRHMLHNRVTPAQGSMAQVALAEVARPISRVLEQEIALHRERIDSLAANEGHRPYAAEYRRHDEPASAMPNRVISSLTP